MKGFVVALLGATMLTMAPAEARDRWSEAQANAWYAKQPWLVGANYTPASAINQFEMWQAETWDPKRIDYELNLAQGIGMNAGCRRVQAAHRRIPADRGTAQDQAAVRAVRQLLGSQPQAGAAASADPRRP